MAETICHQFKINLLLKMDMLHILIFVLILSQILTNIGINFSNDATFSNAITEIVDVKIVEGIVKYNDENDVNQSLNFEGSTDQFNNPTNPYI